MVGELPDPARTGGVALRAGGRRDRPRRAGRCLARRAPSLPSCGASWSLGCREADLAGVVPTLASSATRCARRALSVAHDVSDGGLACALAECAIAGDVGCRVDVAAARARLPPRRAVRRGPGRVRRLRRRRRARRSAARTGARIGTVGGDALVAGEGELGGSPSCRPRTARWRPLLPSGSRRRAPLSSRACHVGGHGVFPLASVAPASAGPAARRSRSPCSPLRGRGANGFTATGDERSARVSGQRWRVGGGDRRVAGGARNGDGS